MQDLVRKQHVVQVARIQAIEKETSKPTTLSSNFSLLLEEQWRAGCGVHPNVVLEQLSVVPLIDW
jgi:hypothetical protein